MKTQETKWAIDPIHSKVAFKVKHLMISNVLGNFKEFEGQVSTDGDDFSTAEINFSLSAASIDTEMADRDGHLKSPDFFDAEKYPKITFSGKGMKDLGDEMFELTGDLTIKDVTKSVTLTVEYGGIMSDPWGNVKAGFSLSGKINRKDFGLNWNAALEAGGVLVGEEVKISGDIELAKVVA
ncbi:MAG: YceI family protein [Prolixibacteraceae bacterium]|nr:YceI family protein [Prolixibacteraceae bacterium]